MFQIASVHQLVSMYTLHKIKHKQMYHGLKFWLILTGTRPYCSSTGTQYYWISQVIFSSQFSHVLQLGINRTYFQTFFEKAPASCSSNPTVLICLGKIYLLFKLLVVEIYFQLRYMVHGTECSHKYI